MSNEEPIKTANSEWKSFLVVAGIASFVLAAIIPIQAGLYFIFPPPTSVSDYFVLLQQRPFVGLIDLDVLLTLDNLIVVLIYLGLYAVLRSSRRPAVSVALVFGLIGISLYLVSREATFTMLPLSSRFATAATEAEKQALSFVGQTLLTMYNGSCFEISYVLGGITLFIFSVVMLSDSQFKRSAGIVGVVMSVLMLVPPTIGYVGLVISLVSLIPTFVWLILIGISFISLGNRRRAESVSRRFQRRRGSKTRGGRR